MEHFRFQRRLLCLSKFTRSFLQSYTDYYGKWCILPDGNAFMHICDDWDNLLIYKKL